LARRSAEEAAAVPDAKVQPPGAAEVLPGPSARQPVAAQEAGVVSDAEAQPQEVAEAVSGAAAGLQPAAAGVARDAAAEPQQVEAAEERPDAEAQQPVVRPDPSVRRPVAAPPSWRPEDHPHPWLAPRRAARSAHAMQRSRAASPSKRSWRAAGCEALS